MTPINPALTLRQLRRIASERAIEGWSLMTKDELIAALAVHERNHMMKRFAAAETGRISQADFHQRLSSALSGVMQTAVDSLADQ